jgi:hypothetical protein
MNPEYTNAARLIDRLCATARKLEDALDECAMLHAESVRVGGDLRLSPVFFTLDPVTGAPTETPRIDLGFSLAELDLALSAMLILSGGADNGLTGLAAQIQAARASLDKIKR